MELIKIDNCHAITPSRILSDATVIIKDGIIEELTTDRIEIPGAKEIDGKGLFVSPGFIDLHTHGAGNHDFMDGSVEAYLEAARVHAMHGTTLLYPTTLTSTNEALFASFEKYEEACSCNHRGAAFGGIHLEGPYFAYSQRGAQDPRFLKNPVPSDYLEILSHTNHIARWSIAPELPGALDLGCYLDSKGILPSIAHTDATYEEILKAFDSGYRHITHFYSAMSGITRRNAYRHAGVIESGYLIDGMTLEIIADGIHVPKSLMQLVYKIKGAENIALVTDSMRAAGMPDGKSILGSLEDGLEVVIEEGVAKLPDRSAFAGSIATADRLVRTATKIAEIPLCEAVRMATATPARIMDIQQHKGSLQKGKDADLILFDENIDIKMTMIKGKIVFENLK